MIVIPFLKKYKYTIVVFLYFLVIAYFQIYISWNRGSFIYYFINASSLLLILHLISKIKFRIISIIFSFVFSLLVSFEAYYGFFFKCTISLGIISSIMETNVAEVADVMRGRILPCIIIFCFTFFAIFQSVDELKKLNVRVKWSVLFLFAYIFICFPLYVFQKIERHDDFDLYYTGSPVRTCNMLITERFPLLYGQISSVVVYFQEKQQVKKYLVQDRILPEGVFFKDSEGLPEKIFFVLGESQYNKHLSLYGYDINTTPFLDSLYRAASGMTVYNAISPGCTTLDVTRLLFTFETPNNKKAFFEQKNIIELANDAGYQTIWLSNQITFDIWGSVIAHISSLSNDIYSTGYKENTKETIDDLRLIPVLQGKYAKSGKQFFIIHLQGSHGGYDNKYDKTDKAFIKGNSITAHYDRSIHHTDRVLREIYNVMKADTSAVLFYMSDHGENIEMNGHGFINGGFCQFEVPMFIVNQTKMCVDSIVDKYYLHEKKRINTLCTTNILAEMMGYSFPDEMISHIREEQNYITHSDGKVYKYDELK